MGIFQNENKYILAASHVEVIRNWKALITQEGNFGDVSFVKNCKIFKIFIEL